MGLTLPAGPKRDLAVATFINTVGAGMFMASSALYFTRIVGLPTGQIALGLGAGALIGLAAGVVSGRIADRAGARRTLVVTMVLGAAGMSCFTLVWDFWSFLVVNAINAVLFAAGQVVMAPLVRQVGEDDQVRYRAGLRSVSNLAVAAGTAIAGIAIQADTETAYLALIFGRAAALLACVPILRRLPVPRVTGKPTNWIAVRDIRYLRATAVNGLMSLHFAVLGFAFPLWIVEHTQAPRWLVPGSLILNTALVMVCQVRASRNVGDVRSAAVRMRWAGFALLTAMALIAAASGTGTVTAVLLLLVGVVVYTVGELWHAAASMEFMYGLAPETAQGEYAGVFNLGVGLARSAGPAVFGLTALSWGPPGWLLLGVLFAATGLVAGPLVAQQKQRTELVET